MIGKIILFTIGSILIVLGLIGIYQMQTQVNCNIIKEQIHNNWCNDISGRTYGIFDSMVFNGLALIIIGSIVAIKNYERQIKPEVEHK